jgi:hypothetical protein
MVRETTDPQEFRELQRMDDRMMQAQTGTATARPTATPRTKEAPGPGACSLRLGRGSSSRALIALAGSK